VATVAEVFALALQKQQAGNFSHAEQLYRQILQAEPSNANAWGYLGSVSQAQGKLKEAEFSFRRVAQLLPDNASAHNCLAVVLVQQNKPDEAAASLQEALRCQPENAETHNNLGSVLARLGRTAEAIDSYRQALRLKPNYAQAHYNLGLALKTAGQRDGALVEFQEALRCQPDFALALHALGDVLVEKKNLAEAESSYRQALRLGPDRVETHHNLGSLLQSQGRLDEAVACYRQALMLNPNFAEAYCHLGTALQKQGRLDQALAFYHQALGLNPNFALAHYHLGTALQSQDRLAEAVVCYRQALLLNPNFAEAHNNLGSLLQSQDRLDEAVAAYHQALRLNPNYAEAHNNLGTVLQSQGRWDEALACYRHALRVNANFPEAHKNLGSLFQSQGRWDEAMACYRQALLLNPNFAEAHYNLGSALQTQGRLEEAVPYYRQAVELNPGFAVAHINLGFAMWELGRLDKAAACYRRALELDPQCVDAHIKLARVLREQGQGSEAIACCRRALELEPDNPGALARVVNQLQHLCVWEGLGGLAQRVVEAVAKDAGGGNTPSVDPFLFLALPTATTADQHRQCAHRWVEQFLRSVPGPTYVVRSKDLGPRTSDFGLRTSDFGQSVITVGYLSADFHEHATAYLIAELIEQHQRQRFAVFAYSLGADDGGPMRRRLVKAFDRFVDLKDASFVAAARRIEADEVDILVDLKGYTRQARPQIMAIRPAPIQVNYLGYPGTMAAPFIDYILVDDFVVPADQQPFFTEKLVHLPGCYQVNDSQRQIAAHTPSRAECGLPEGGFVFCCFNSNHKITPEVFEVWMCLLKAVPGSVLWLLEDNPVTSANLRKEALARGVLTQRLVFAPRLGLPEHLARHRLADLFLDTLPYNAHTTASDALWAGCPLLTMAGQTFPSRVAGSLLRTVGLPELITTSLQEYKEMALRLARDADLLKDLRARLQANRKTSRLFDGERFARSLEQAFVTMWEIYTSGEEPRGFKVPTMA